MSYRTDDPHKDFDRWDRQREEWLESRPVCDGCFNPIQDDHYYDINGEKMCEDCLIHYFRRVIEA